MTDTDTAAKSKDRKSKDRDLAEQVIPSVGHMLTYKTRARCVGRLTALLAAERAAEREAEGERHKAMAPVMYEARTMTDHDTAAKLVEEHGSIPCQPCFCSICTIARVIEKCARGPRRNEDDGAGTWQIVDPHMLIEGFKTLLAAERAAEREACLHLLSNIASREDIAAAIRSRGEGE